MEKLELEKALETMNQREAAEHFGVHLATVKRAIKRLDIEYKKKSGGCQLYRGSPLDANASLTKEQDDIIAGSLLGDGFVLNCDIFRIKQKNSRREYVDRLHQKMSPFSTPVRVDRSRKPTRLKDGTVSHKLEHWKGGFAWAASFSTRKHQIFADLRNKWYPKGKKIVPDDLKLNERVLTHWYLQDGCHNKQRNYYKFSTQSFTVKETKFLSKKLNKKYNVNSQVQFQTGSPVIYVTKTNGEDTLTEIFRRNVFFKCFQYKI